ncbi:MAG: PrsW family intramembrane metalloprotease [Solobacterium sp.]|nr:PrsW family intramembrane metalloprotease [Solobacterium sp.]
MSDIVETFTSMDTRTLIFSLVAAVAPAIFWMIYIYRKDKLEREPISLLIRMVFGGILSAFAAIILEMIVGYIEAFIFVNVRMDIVLMTFITAMDVGIVEECCKYFFLKKFSWKNKNFNYSFDGVVFAVFTSLGFALFENILYVFNYGIEVAGPRALLTIPAHMTFGVFMGVYYGKAKSYEVINNAHQVKKCLRNGVLFAIVTHGIYDMLAMLCVDSVLYYLAFIIFVVCLDIIVIKCIKKYAREDQNILYLKEQEADFFEEILPHSIDEMNNVE